MFETFRHIRGQLLLAAIGSLVLGILMLIQPGLFLKLICYVMGALLIAYGVIGILGCLKNHLAQMFSIVFYVIVAGLGIYIIAAPETISSILPVIFGILLALDGMLNLRHAIGLRRFGDPGSVTIFIIGIITVVLGAVILFHPYSTAQLTFRLVGAALAYNGLSDLLVLYRMNHANKIYRQRNPESQDHVIDVEVRPVDDDKEE